MIKIKKIIFFILIFSFCISKGNTEISDGLFATVGNKAITKSDIVNEVKIILILNNRSYSAEIRDQLRDSAIRSIIKRTVKQIAIERNDFLKINKIEFNAELDRLAANLNMDVETLKNICATNNLDFSLIKTQVEVELLWQSLIFEIYKDRLSINAEEINEQLNSLKDKKNEIVEYLISEIILSPENENESQIKIEEVKYKIKTDGFEKTAIDLSISESAIKGGNLGWLNENIISEKFKSVIMNTSIGNVSEPIIVPQGIIFFQVNDKRTKKLKRDLEDAKNQLVKTEKTKILNMYSLTHYDKLRRATSIKVFDE